MFNSMRRKPNACNELPASALGQLIHWSANMSAKGCQGTLNSCAAIDLRQDEEYTAPTLREQRGEVPRYRQLSPGHEQTWTAKVPLVDWQPPTTGGEVHFDLKLSLLTPTLDVEATTAVVRYHHASWRQPRRHREWRGTGPGRSGVGVRGGPQARRMATDDESRIADAAARRHEYQSADPQDGLTGFENTVIVSLSPAAHTMMRAIALHRGQGSVETLVRELCMNECKLFAEAVLNSDQTTLDGLF